jgi:hypothetical protein
MTKAVALTAVLFLSFAASNANAQQHCWWDARTIPPRMECHPGWEWRDGREWQREHQMRREYGPRGEEYRREEYREEERRHHEEVCARYPWKC